MNKFNIKKLLREALSIHEAKQHTDDEIVDFDQIDMRYEFDKLNQLLFNGEVKPVPFLWNTKKNAHGTVKATINRLTGEIFVQSLSMSKFLDIPYKFFKDTLAHEMIHVYLLQKNINDGHGFRFIKEMSRINNMGLGFEVTVTNSQYNFNISQNVAKKGLELVYCVLDNNKTKNQFFVMKYPTYKSEGYYIASLYRNLIRAGRFTFAKGEFYKSDDINLQAEKIQRSFKRSVSYTIIPDDKLQTLKKNSTFLSSFTIDNGEINFEGNDKPIVPTFT